jgi:hypothetical protein
MKKPVNKLRGVLLAAAIGTAFFLLLNAPTVVRFWNQYVQSHYDISLSDAASMGISVDDVKKYVNNYMLVPNYDVETYLESQISSPSIGENYTFHVRIADTGIVHLSIDKYFYILAFDPSGRSSGMFPWVQPYTLTSSISHSKWPAWSEDVTLPANVQRDDLFNGFVGNVELRYSIRFPDDPQYIGVWTFYVVVFDASYVDRWGAPFPANIHGYENKGYGNAVGFTLKQVSVQGKRDPATLVTESWPAVISLLLPFFLSCWGYYKEADRIDDLLSKAHRIASENWLWVAIVLVVVYLAAKLSLWLATV